MTFCELAIGRLLREVHEILAQQLKKCDDAQNKANPVK